MTHSLIRVARLLCLALIALCSVPMAADAGLDKVYVKPSSQPSWIEWASRLIGPRDLNKSYALVIGISNYSGSYEPLDTTEDAKRMRDYLLNDAHFDYVHILTDEKVTKRRVEELMLEDFPQRVGANDLFYFTGPAMAMKGLMDAATLSVIFLWLKPTRVSFPV